MKKIVLKNMSKITLCFPLVKSGSVFYLESGQKSEPIDEALVSHQIKKAILKGVLQVVPEVKKSTVKKEDKPKEDKTEKTSEIQEVTKNTDEIENDIKKK